MSLVFEHIVITGIKPSLSNFGESKFAFLYFSDIFSFFKHIYGLFSILVHILHILKILIYMYKAVYEIS